MEISYWQSRWRKDNTGWHMDNVYPPLANIWSQLSIKSSAKVFVPLCGKSLDLRWLVERGHQVTGVDVSQKALEDVINYTNQSFTKDSSHGFTIYRSESLELWQGDFLKLPVKKIPQPDVIYDKASIVALPPEMRGSYAQKILSLCGKHTHIILQTFEYDQSEMNGPPFSVDENELKHHFGHDFEFTLMHEQSKLEELSKFQQRGLSSYLTEKVYHLTPFDRD